MKLLILLFASILSAAQDIHGTKATGDVWLDLFGGPQGVVVYPQYSWRVTTSMGTFNGFGFVEVAPHEPFFTNHLVVFTPRHAEYFSIHTETGGLPNAGRGFFQIGPRLNVNEVVRPLKKVVTHAFVTALPRFKGIRSNNLLVSAGTREFQVHPEVKISVDGYRRFFPHRPDYGEYWFLVHPRKTPHMQFAVFALQDGSRWSTSFGVRIQ